MPDFGHGRLPIREADLIRAIEVVAPASSRQRSVEPGKQTRPTVPNTTKWLERVGGNVKLLGELVETFRADCPLLLAEIEGSIRESHPDDLSRAAHTLKSMLLFFEATRASEAALQLETMGLNTDLAGSRETFIRLSAEVERLLEQLAALPGTGLP